MNTSVTVGEFTYKCVACKADPHRNLSWGPWRMCCRQEAGQPGSSTPRYVSKPVPAGARPLETEKKSSKKPNKLGPFMTMQKTTCGAMWNYEEGMTEHKKEPMGIPPADVYGWGANYVKSAKAI